MESIDNKKHRISINDRNYGLITGVIQINEFDSNVIDMDTIKGRLIIKGKNLLVKGINSEKGDAEISGNIDSFSYHGNLVSESTFKKIFK